MPAFDLIGTRSLQPLHSSAGVDFLLPWTLKRSRRRRRRRRLRRTKLSDGERGFAGLAAISLRTARCLPVAGIHAGVRRDGLATGRAIYVGTRGDHRVPEISRHRLPLGPARLDGSRSGGDAEIGATRHSAMIDLNIANGGRHAQPPGFRHLADGLALLDIR
jgi:hypothetical protein